MEPEKCAWWNWYSMKELENARDVLFPPVRELISQGYDPFK